MCLRKKIIKDNEISPTKCGLFLLPTIDFANRPISKADCIGLIDVYISDKKAQLISVYKNIDTEVINMQIYKLTNHYSFIDHGEEEDELYVVNEIPKKFIKDYNLFLNGKYSEFSDELKDRLSKINGKTTFKVGGGLNKKGLPGLTVYDMINPSEEKRKELADILGVDVKLVKEVYNPPNLENEIYLKLDKFKEKYGY